MINRNKSELPKNYHLSIAKMIDDVFVAGFADLYEGFIELDPTIRFGPYQDSSMSKKHLSTRFSAM